MPWLMGPATGLVTDERTSLDRVQRGSRQAIADAETVFVHVLLRIDMEPTKGVGGRIGNPAKYIIASIRRSGVAINAVISVVRLPLPIVEHCYSHSSFILRV